MNEQTSRLGTEFPTKGFVQSALEAYFGSLGFLQVDCEPEDYVGLHPKTREIWLIEAKGETSDVGLDLRTGLGQILQHRTEPSVLYGLAVPRTPKFLAQCAKLPSRVRVVLGLHWILVDRERTIAIVRPEETLPGLGA